MKIKYRKDGIDFDGVFYKLEEIVEKCNQRK